MSFTSPDWRDASRYPTPDLIPDMSFWAWQFLRRNQAYQNDWSDYIDDLRSLVLREPKWIPFLEKERHLAGMAWGVGTQATASNVMTLLSPFNQPIENVHVEPPALPSETTLDEWRSRVLTNGTAWAIQPRVRALGAKWGLDWMQSPAADKLLRSNRFILNGHGPCFLGDLNPYVEDGDFASVAFDLRMPADVLRAQFELVLKVRQQRIAGRDLEPYQARPQRAQSSYSNYLRVLDAMSSGAKIDEIAASLQGHIYLEDAKKVVRNWIKAAEKLRDESYRILPVYSQTVNNATSKKSRKVNAP